MYQEMLISINELEDGTDESGVFWKAVMRALNNHVAFSGKTQADIAAKMNISTAMIQKMLSQPAPYLSKGPRLAEELGMHAESIIGPDELRQFLMENSLYAKVCDALLRYRPTAGRDRRESPSKHAIRLIKGAPINTFKLGEVPYLTDLFSGNKPANKLSDMEAMSKRLEGVLKLPSDAICNPSHVIEKQSVADNVLKNTKGDIAINVKRLMEEKKISVQDLAALAGVPDHSVSLLLEKGKNFCTLKLLTALAAALDVRVAALVTAGANKGTKFSPDFSDLPKVARDFLCTYLDCIRDRNTLGDPSPRATAVLLATPFMTHAVGAVTGNGI